MADTFEDNTDLLSINELATIFRISKWTIYRWNSDGTGPNRIKIGRHVYYRREDVVAWMDKRLKITMDAAVETARTAARVAAK